MATKLGGGHNLCFPAFVVGRMLHIPKGLNKSVSLSSGLRPQITVREMYWEFTPGKFSLSHPVEDISNSVLFQLQLWFALEAFAALTSRPIT